MLIITRRKKGLHKKVNMIHDDLDYSLIVVDQCKLISLFFLQQSSLTEKWASTCSRGANSVPHESPFKYVVYKQPLSLDRFYIHDISAAEGAGKLLTIK